jgi:hypothetical protein
MNASSTLTSRSAPADPTDPDRTQPRAWGAFVGCEAGDYSAAVTMLRSILSITLAILLAGAAGCGIFDDRGSRRRGGGRQAGGERCDIDVDQWKSRVRHFQDKGHQNRDTFRKTKDDLLRDLDKLDTAACRRDIRKEIDELIDEVREESF